MYMARTQKVVPNFQINTQKWVFALFFIIGFFLNPSIAESKPNQGGGQGSGNKDYHHFRYDPVEQVYHLKGKIPVSAVQMDLNGALCSKCHSEELRRSRILFTLKFKHLIHGLCFRGRRARHAWSSLRLTRNDRSDQLHQWREFRWMRQVSHRPLFAGHGGCFRFHFQSNGASKPRITSSGYC